MQTNKQRGGQTGGRRDRQTRWVNEWMLGWIPIGGGQQADPEEHPRSTEARAQTHRQTHKDTQTLGRQESRPDSYLEEPESRIGETPPPPPQDRASNHHQHPGSPSSGGRKKTLPSASRPPSLGSDPIENERSEEGRPGEKTTLPSRLCGGRPFPLRAPLAAGADGSCSPRTGTGQSNGAP